MLPRKRGEGMVVDFMSFPEDRLGSLLERAGESDPGIGGTARWGGGGCHHLSYFVFSLLSVRLEVRYRSSFAMHPIVSYQAGQ